VSNFSIRTKILMKLTKIVFGLKTILILETAVDGNSQLSGTKQQRYEWIRDLEWAYSGQYYEHSVSERKVHLGSHDQSP
jgi:hypothetical protein